jgi:hypothetical protein
MKIAFAGAFAPRLAEPVKAELALPYEIVVGDEGAIVTQLADVDVLASTGFTGAMAAAAPKLRLLQLPGRASIASTAAQRDRSGGVKSHAVIAGLDPLVSGLASATKT